jgi:hypothetical protein
MRFGKLAAGALGLALLAGGAPSFVKAEALSQFGTPGQYGMPDTGLTAPGTGNQPKPGTGGTGQEDASLAPNTAAGWKIRVCSEKTKADRIDFKLTTAGSKSSYGTGASGNASGIGGTGGASDTAMGSAEHTAAWNRGEATEIKVPIELRDAEKLRIEATPSQKDKQASVCLIYGDHVAKKLNFDDREVSTVKRSDNGECGC